MRRRHAILATTAGAAMVGGLLFAPQAQADPQLCIDLDIKIQDEEIAESGCFPDDGSAPELPGAPTEPGLPTLP
jgi:hypothetical protein